jgi:hypothetical protein
MYLQNGTVLREGRLSHVSVSVRAGLVSVSGSHGLLNYGTRITIGKPTTVYAALIKL